MPPNTPPAAPATATGDVHVHHAGGGSTDIKGYDGGIFNMHQAANISLNAKFTYANFTLSPEDPRSDEVLEVQGSHLTEAFITARTLLAGAPALMTIDYGSERPFTAHLQVKQQDKTIMETHLAPGKGPVIVGDVKAQMLETKPVTVLVSNKQWQYTVVPGTYHTASDSVRQTRIDVSVKAITDPTAHPVAPHGLIGQGFDGRYIDGKKDDYKANKNGVFRTSAQGEGAIEGTLDDYIIEPANPFSTAFKFARFDKASAPMRDVTGLKELPRGTTIELAGSAASATGDEVA